MNKKTVSVVSGCFNEEDNVTELCNRVKAVFEKFPQYNYEHIFIDNASTDNTVGVLEDIIKENPNVKIIVNNRNFGHITSPYYGILSATGDAVIYLVSDLQDPPELIEDFLNLWENGTKIVVGVKNSSSEAWLFYFFRTFFYGFMNKLSSVKLIKNYTGFGLYDQEVISILRNYNEPYPYFRGLVLELGYDIKTINFHQPVRKRGVTKNNFYTLYDIAMLGVTSHSWIPLRLATMFGFFMSAISFLVSMFYLVYKLIYWDRISLGIAPIIVGAFFMFSVVLFFIGILGEYIINLQRYAQNRPHVIEKKRINF